MAQPELDWTFDNIPSEHDPPVTGAAPAPARIRLRRSHRRNSRRPLALALLALIIASAGLYLTSRVGWQRVRAQIASEVVYEDAQALAGSAAAVQAIQAQENFAWVEQRGNEAALGYPAYPPAEDLLPAPEAPQILEVHAPDSGTITVTVLRSFANSAGQRYSFEYEQHYRNLGAGQWERLPPDASLQASRVEWIGRRVHATLPAAELEVLQPLLQQVDAYLAQICTEWRCPNNLVVPVTFTADLGELPRLTRPRRPATEAGGSPGYPVVFDLAFRSPRYPTRVILPALHLGGQPHDEAAAQALVRSMTGNLLAYMASELANSSRGPANHYLDALIARAEIRLGLSAVPRWPIGVQDYLPPDALWPRSNGYEARARRPDVVARLQALNFLDYALDDSLPSADSHLLKKLRQARSVAGWLEGGLGLDGTAIVDGWAAEMTARFAADGRAPDWTQLEGLNYLCEDGSWLVRGGSPYRLPFDARHTWLPAQALAPDGSRLALLTYNLATHARLQVLNLEDGTRLSVEEEAAWPLGWSSGGELVYLSLQDSDRSTGLGGGLRLYDPRTGLRQRLSHHRVMPRLGPPESWSGDHNLLALTVIRELEQANPQPTPAVLSFASGAQLLQLANLGHSVTVSPDGQRLAYVVADFPWREPAQANPDTIEIVDLGARTAYALQAPPQSPAAPFQEVRSLLWSPAGDVLAFVDYQTGTDPHLYTLTLGSGGPSTGGDLREIPVRARDISLISFSADGRYLLAYSYDSQQSRIVLFDLDTGQEQTFPGNDEATAVWSPRGHQLAIAGPGGLYVTDPRTGEYQWITGRNCMLPGWYELPETAAAATASDTRE